MMITLVSALPAAISAPLTAVFATIDSRFLFAILWAVAALAVGAIVRSALARRDARYKVRMHVVKGAKRPERQAA